MRCVSLFALFVVFGRGRSVLVGMGFRPVANSGFSPTRRCPRKISWQAMGCQVTAISRGEKKKALAEKSGADGGLMQSYTSCQLVTDLDCNGHGKWPVFYR